MWNAWLIGIPKISPHKSAIPINSNMVFPSSNQYTVNLEKPVHTPITHCQAITTFIVAQMISSAMFYYFIQRQPEWHLFGFGIPATKGILPTI